MPTAGNAIVIWVQPDLPYYRLYARRYVPGTGWDAVLTIDDNTGTCSLPRIAADAAGNVIAVWQHDDGGSASIYANRYSVTSGWGTAGQISNGTGNAFNPNVAVNSSGAAMAVWYQDDGGTYNAYASRFSPGTDWEAAQLIESGSSNAYFVRVAIDDAGAAIAVWRQPDIYFNRYVHGTGWSTEQVIAQGFVDNPGIAMNAQGKAIATWNQWNPASASPGDALVYTKRFDPTAGWGTTASLMSELGSANAPQAVVDSLGNAMIIWSQSVATRAGGATTAVFTQKY
jgi:hypothetical protein